MLTDADQIEALRQRLLKKLREKEEEIRELQEMIRVLGEAPKVLSDEARLPAAVEDRPGARYNRNLAQLVNDYIEAQPNGKAIVIGRMIESLKAEHGVCGKDKSLYAYIHSLLRKASEKGILHHERGVGFYKPTDTQNQDESRISK